MNTYNTIFSIAFPNILSNLSIPLLSFVDTLIVGHMDDASFLGALALASMIFNLLYWSFGFLRMSTTALCAQSHGATTDNSLNQDSPFVWFLRSLFMGLFIGLCIILLKNPIQTLCFHFVESSQNVIIAAQTYFQIRIFAAPATLSLYAINGYFFGVQDSKTPLVLTILANVFNIFLNYILVYHFAMNIDGVAYATLVAQYLSFFIGLILIFRKQHFSQSMKHVFNKVSFLKIIRVNTDIFIRTLCLIMSFSLFTIYSSKISDDVLAVNSLLMQFYGFLSYGMDGFALAAESLIAKYIGSKDVDSLKDTIVKIWRCTWIVVAIYTLIFYFAFESIITMLTHHTFLLDQSKAYLWWIVLAPILNSPAYIYDGIFLGSIQSVYLRNAMVFSFFIIYLPSLLFISPQFGNHGLWLAMSLFMIARAVSLKYYLKKVEFV
ncbi:MAG: MATE family efflux transporter [Candidatus Cloacimonetes bacterium]|nr:MATE family efflux transporter [Candidatus Cloacimonadota bacterium]